MMALVKTEMGLPTAYRLAQNYPNPFNPTTTINYALPATGEYGLEIGSLHTSLKVFNLLGQEVRSLVDEVQETGYYTVTWNGRDNKGMQVSSGIYFYRLSVNEGQWLETKRMVLTK